MKSKINKSCAEIHPQVRDLAEEGLRLVPCSARGKKPLIKKWGEKASSDVATLCSWAQTFGELNWAVATGSKSGVFVLDVDAGTGRNTLTQLEREYGRLPDTRRSKTGNGVHVWFRCPPSVDVRSSVGRLGTGLDIRGEGACAIVPPSVHPSGRPYKWLNEGYIFNHAPTWLTDLMLQEKSTPAVSDREPFEVHEGQRNDALTRRAGVLRRRGAERQEIELQLITFNVKHCKPPLSEREVCAIAASIMRYAAGGLDPLQRAFRKMTELPVFGARDSKFQFFEFCRQLQLGRREHPIIVPLVRIGEMFAVHFTTIQRWRKEAVKLGILLPIEENYIPRKAAGEYWFRWNVYNESYQENYAADAGVSS